MRNTLLLVLLTLFVSPAFAQTLTLSGKVTDDAGKPIPFASVYIKNTTKGTSANSEGGYNLNLPKGRYEVLFKAVGYKQESKSVNLEADTKLDVSLKGEQYQLNEVSVRSGGEDPAYDIIRKAIKKRKTYLNEVNAYSCEVYIKGLQRLLAAPKKFLGFDVQKFALQNGLDSNRRGIIYLSESQSKFNFMKPDKVHEEMISSKVSGSNRAFSFNRASDIQVNFYENMQNWEGISNRPVISPIADNALSFYKYKLIGATIENGETINKIQVSPRNENNPCFNGYIYILEDTWRLQSLSLYITKKANINFVDTLRVDEQYVPINNKIWMPASMKFEFNGGFMGFKFAGYFVSLYKDYDINPQLDKSQFKETLRISKGINKMDSIYWQQQRPIPLTDEEKTDYKKKEVLAAKRESKQYLDSIDNENNKVNVTRLILRGYRHRNRFKHEYFTTNSLLSAVQYNTVEGLSLNYGGVFSKLIDSLNNRRFAVYGNVRYGFSNKLFNAYGGLNIPVGEATTLNLSGGSTITDLNEREPMSPFVNSLYSLLNRQNFEKLYQKQFASALLNTRIYGGWKASASAEWANRKWLDNTADYSLFQPKGHEFTSNNPLVPDADVPLFENNQSFKISLHTTYDFSNSYETYPTGRRYLPSKYPTLGIGFTKAIKNVFGSDADYNLITADITNSDISMGYYGKFSFWVGAGKFFNTKNIYYTDLHHFAGNQILAYKPGIDKFLLLNYYSYSTGDKYLEGHIEHNFSGLFTNIVPLLRKLKLQEIIDVNYLSTPTLKNYTELGFGFQTNFGLRVMYGTSFNNDVVKADHALRVGLSF
ncbi:MAG: carboxypeptidase-like regulatory domain-containing protein [Mucilaginibacter sp.]|nr:carboxypeptidase-like regulatory domain-containing protein [Mucilaginibacter sp.]